MHSAEDQIVALRQSPEYHRDICEPHRGSSQYLRAPPRVIAVSVSPAEGQIVAFQPSSEAYRNILAQPRIKLLLSIPLSMASMRTVNLNVCKYNFYRIVQTLTK